MNRIYYKHTRTFIGTEGGWGGTDDLSWVKKGSLVFLREIDYEDGGHLYDLVPYRGEGYPGNSGNIIKRYHGWRGTTQGTAIYVYGVREVLEVGELKTDERGNQTLKVTLSKDLYPDRD